MLSLAIFASFHLHAETYPSTRTSWVLPGGWQAPTDPETARTIVDAQAVKFWEIAHADIAFGADYGLDGNKSIASIGYMYNQVLNFEPGLREWELRKGALSAEQEYEDFFLHFSVDTVLEIDNSTHSTSTPFSRLPDVIGYTANPGHAGHWIYQTPPFDVDAWQHSDNGGALHILLYERFDEITLSLSQFAGAGELLLEYPSAINAAGEVTNWSRLAINDGTHGLSQNGAISWTPPVDWQLAALHDGSGASFGGGPYFAQTLLRDGGRMYAVRLRWQRSTSSDQQPRLSNALLRDWMPHTNTGARLIPGWDARNDRNGDGYVDDQEIQTLMNAHASARFRYESRVSPLGRMWSSQSSWSVSNLFSPAVRNQLVSYLAADWSAKGLQGAYNDDLFKTVGPSQFQVISGGSVAESAHTISSPAIESEYVSAFASLLNQLRQTSASKFVAGNISGTNLFIEPKAYAMVDALGSFLREAYFHAAQGLTGSFGVNKAWDLAALSALGKNSLVQMTTRYGNVRQIANSQENWKKDQEALLALYYLVNQPPFTSANFWHHSYQYGSNNTDASIYHKAGVPKNIAYQPSALLSRDIGEPQASMPDGYEPMKYMVKTQSDGGYSIIGDTTDTVLRHPELAHHGEVNVLPTYTFYLQRNADHASVPGAPTDAVLARQYAKGLVVYRTDFAGFSASFRRSISQPISLPSGRLYARVDRNNPEALSFIPVREVQLAGYEGALFVDITDALLDSAKDATQSSVEFLN